MRAAQLVLALGIAGGVAGCGGMAVHAAPASGPAAHAATSDAPRTVGVRGRELALARRRIAAGDPTLLPAYHQLIADAEAALSLRPITVTAKQLVPPSGDRHDYMSFGPYWWPDTTKPGGLPYVRRDGIVNPQSRVDHDGWRMLAMKDAVEALALAWYFTGDDRYAERAARLVRTFFLDPATRMNPHLRFAQAIPGVSEGRGIGILDSRHLVPLVDAIRIIEPSPAWSEADERGMQQWVRTYLDWLRTSPNGRDEADEENNHGTFYDMQVVALALYVGDTTGARATLTEATIPRIDRHFAADGRQPLELARTRPLHYSLFNLQAFTQLAELARAVGVDLWRHAGPDGAGIVDAVRFVAPYVDPARVPPWKDVSPVADGGFMLPLRRAAVATGDSALAASLRHLPARALLTDRSVLMHASVQPRVGFDAVLDAALDRALAQLRRTATALDPAKGYPRVTRPDGGYEQHPARQWTSGFFPGALWYAYQYTRDPAWRALAHRWTAGIEEVKTVRTTHDLGFMVFNSFGHGHLLTGEPGYREVVLEASRSLASRYDPTVGAIKSWETAHHPDHRATWKFPVIVDNLMNLEMLFWAGTHGGDPAWTALAARHARTSARAHIRPDGSTAHVALFDPASGRLERTVTWQGHADSSAWARGQAWAIHGFAAAYGRTRDPVLLAAAIRVADWFLAHMPADAVPFWDFRHPDLPRTERDASAGAIAAAGLYDLARYTGDGDATRYRAAADRLLLALAAEYAAPDSPTGALLRHSVGQRPQGVEIDVGIVYADYYFIEALLRRRGLFLE